MTTLIVGASGATGVHLVEQLLLMGTAVKAMVRSPDRLPASLRNHKNLTIIKGSVVQMSVDELAEHVNGCWAVASCLGHKTIYGKPRKLVTEAVSLLCEAIRKNQTAGPVKFVLMNTTGNSNRDLNERVSVGHRAVVALLRLLLPPHPDNEQAAEYLRVKIGRQNPSVEWVVVRPDSLINHDQVTTYTLHRSPVRDPIFDPGTTSRINVAHFMARLITEDALWAEWKGQMPVIYNVEG